MKKKVRRRVKKDPPCLNMGVLFLPFSVFLEQTSHHYLQVLAAYSVNSSRVQFLPALGSFSFSRRRIIQDAYHFDVTDVSAMALLLRIPFFDSASGFRKNTSFTIFHELGASIWCMKRS